jgi:hypothetical protein
MVENFSIPDGLSSSSVTSVFVTTGATLGFMLFVPPLSVVFKIPSGVNEIPSIKFGEEFSSLPVILILFTLV